MTIELSEYVIDAIADAVVKKMQEPKTVSIPEGATRADVFKIVFGYTPAKDLILCNENDWCGENEACKYCTSNSQRIGREEDWWDAPYKDGKE